MLKARLFRTLTLVWLLASSRMLLGDDTPIVLTEPLPYQVFQRLGYVPPLDDSWAASPNNRGYAIVNIAGALPEQMAGTCRLHYRIIDERLDKVTLKDASAPTTNPVADDPSEWKQFIADLPVAGPTNFHGSVIVPAGGWYQLQIRATSDTSGLQAFGIVKPIGVGEVFLVAGQSYATNTNDEQLLITDPQQRVVGLNTANGTWAVANDPQPTPDGSDGGSIWPALGDLLVQDLQVPIAFANVAVSATSSTQWLPNGNLHSRLLKTGSSLKRFRAVLWQQGESDVIEKKSAEDYVANLVRIRRTAVHEWGFEPVWLAAKSTLHPTVYNDPQGEQRIRNAIEQLSTRPGFGAGPDTDTLTGENRGDRSSRRHFSGVGQRRAAALWFETLKSRLKTVPTGTDAASFLLNDLHLLQPTWQAEVIHAESSVLRRPDASQPATARLGFPATKIISIRAANGSHQYAAEDDCELSTDGTHVTFRQTGPVEIIQDTDLYLPNDAPNSYKHRTGHPDQNLLYRPGRWFHDRNVEITYRRDVAAAAVSKDSFIYGTLPRTIQRLKSGQAVTLGISGDSISTGLDASEKTGAPPFQPGFPDLVTAQLRVLFDSDIVLKNRAVSGWSVATGVKDLDALLAEKPNLIIVAYGMNDVGRKNPEWFNQQSSEIVRRIKKEADETTEIILVSPMLGNREWIHTPREMFALYRDELKSLVQPGVAFADVTAVWDLMLSSKDDLDLTGNGLNHPNDFGHRLYAQIILQLLVAESR